MPEVRFQPESPKERRGRGQMPVAATVSGAPAVALPHAAKRLGEEARSASGALAIVLRALALLILSCASLAQADKGGAKNQPEERFKTVDPYTKGDPELVKLAGYKSLQPFAFAEGIGVQDMTEVLGGIDLLWAETAHFKLCSTLQTYKSKSDQFESKALEKEFALLAKRIPGFKSPRGNKLDPWLRLHLYAMRLEQLYAEFCERTGYRDEDFPALGTSNAMGSGPYLGQPLKPTVLLVEKSSALGRFNRRFAKSDESDSHRARLAGGSMFYGISAEYLRGNGYELDIALHCAIAASVVGNLLDGLRESHWAVPLWFNIGLGNWFSRRIDPRFTYYAAGTMRYIDDELSDWQPRVRGLVENKFDYSWRQMLATLEWPQLTPQAHMLTWSRVDWMMQQKEAKMRALLDPMSVPMPGGTKEQLAQVRIDRAVAGLSACFGRTPEECEAAWSAWVLKTYERK